MSESTESDQPELEDFSARLQASARFLRQNQPAEAANILKPLYKLMPENFDVACNLGGAYILLRKWDKAVEVLEVATESHPKNAMLWTNLAAAYLGRIETAGPKQQMRAIHAYKQALEVNARTPNVHYHLGLIYKERAELEEARDAFQQALEINPSDNDALIWFNRMNGALAEKESTQENVDASPTESGDYV